MITETVEEWWATLGRGNFAAARALDGLLQRARTDDARAILALMADIRAGKRPAEHLTYDTILNCMGDLNHIRLRDAELAIPSRIALKVLVEEILVHKEYDFPSENGQPLVIDGGVNFGMSLYATKSRYPEAKIIGFEPNPAMYEIAQANIHRNGWKNIELHCAALSSNGGRMPLHLSKHDVMASSLSHRSTHDCEPIDVNTVRLSELLTEPVDFLKLDIEGVEEEVLAEAGQKLEFIKNLFCEIHLDPKTPASRLPNILAIMDRANLSSHLSRSPWVDRKFSSSPFQAVGQSYSISLFARRKETSILEG